VTYDTINFLLSQTRQTPRDFLQLLGNIQRFATDGEITQKQILSGVGTYSFDYFLPEIKDELVGYFAPQEVDLAMRLLASLDGEYLISAR